MSSHKNTVILLNPPAHDIVIRDNYCSKVSQGAYINHPVDFICQSGYLQKDFQIVLIDAVVQKQSIENCLAEIKKYQASHIFCLTGNASWQEDKEFITRIKKQQPDVIIGATGDIFLEDPVRLLRENPSIDGIFLDYTSPGLHRFFTRGTYPYPDMVFRDQNGAIHDHRRERKASREFKIPQPDHSLFLKLNYRYPFVKSRKFATVVTEFGCPFHCAFCVMGTLGCKRRPLEDVLEELESLYQTGIRDIFFLDQSFGSDPQRNKEFCKLLTTRFPRLRWVCFSRVDLVNEEILRTMKKAGCHTIIFGVETATPELLKTYRKGYSLDQVQSVFKQTSRLGIRTVATFLLGLPGETRESALKTIQFAADLPCSYASLNVAVPRMGTDLRQWAVEKGFVNDDTCAFDQSGSTVIMETDSLSAEELAELKKIAVKKLYLNPKKLLKMIVQLRSWDEFLIHAQEGYHLINRFLGSGKK